MSEGVLASLLRVESVSDGVFRARLRDFEGVSFGGDVLARMALAAAATAGDRRLHALHASFLRPVAPVEPVTIRVEPLSDGRTLTRRRVWIERDGRTLCHGTASFLRPVPPAEPIAIRVESLGDGRTLARRRVWIERDGRVLAEGTASFCAAAETGPSWQEVEAPRVPAPEELPADVDVMRERGREWDVEDEEFRWAHPDKPWRSWESNEPAASGRWCVWMRPRQPLPDDPHVHAAALVYVSDLVSHWSACMRLGLDAGPGFYLSLDHALHVHRSLPWDDWWLMENRSEVAGGGRALWQRRVFTRDGALVASIQQEGLIRLPPPEGGR